MQRFGSLCDFLTAFLSKLRSYRAVFHKHRHALLLLIAVLYVYSACPFLCAVFEQQFCYAGPHASENADVRVSSPCCQRAVPGVPGTDAPVPARHQPCCAPEQEMVFPNGREYTTDLCEASGQPLFSILPRAAASSARLRVFFQDRPVLRTDPLFPAYALSCRAPPSRKC